VPPEGRDPKTPPPPSGAIAADSKALHTAHPQAIFQLSQSENWHFTLYLWTCGDFHARKMGKLQKYTSVRCFGIFHDLSPTSSPSLRTTCPNPAQETDKRCVAKHLPLRTFLYNALWRRYGAQKQRYFIKQPELQAKLQLFLGSPPNYSLIDWMFCTFSITPINHISSHITTICRICIIQTTRFVEFLTFPRK